MKPEEFYLTKVMEQLDSWVLCRANGKYVPPYSTDPAHKLSIIDEESLSLGLLQEDYGIQQVREEIKDFAEVIVESNLPRNKKLNSILEIGLGHCGSTHFLWRELFDTVVTIEKSYDRIREFSRNMRTFYNKWVFDDGKSKFLIGYSNEPQVVANSRKIFPHGVDVLFIDGDHRYDAILTDWLLYSPLVTIGGIVAFHDSEFSNTSGAPKFLEQFSTGNIDGSTHTVKHICKSDCAGIAYYIKGY